MKFATNDTAQVWIAFVVQVRLLLKHTIKIFTKFTLLVENALCLKQVCMRCKWLLISLLFAFSDNEWNDTHIFVARIIIKETCPETTCSQTTRLGKNEEQLPQKTVGRLWANSRPTVGRQSANSWPTVGRQSANCWPIVGQLSADGRP